jgi:hypothetical protein
MLHFVAPPQLTMPPFGTVHGPEPRCEPGASVSATWYVGHGLPLESSRNGRFLVTGSGGFLASNRGSQFATYCHVPLRLRDDQHLSHVAFPF